MKEPRESRERAVREPLVVSAPQGTPQQGARCVRVRCILVLVLVCCALVFCVLVGCVLRCDRCVGGLEFIILAPRCNPKKRTLKQRTEV
jgi:hypothetical protein